MARRPVFGRNIQEYPGSLAWIPWLVGKKLKSLGRNPFHGELGTDGTDRTVEGSEK
jgi:hypothetical protein